jgi:hypothetical protein
VVVAVAGVVLYWYFCIAFCSYTIKLHFTLFIRLI